MAKKNKENISSWDKVYVFSGEGWQVRAGVDAACRASQTNNITRYNRECSAKLLFETLTRFQFDDPAEVVSIINPNAEQLKACLEVVKQGKLTSSALIVYTPHDYLDGRNSFSSTATKEKRTWAFPYMEVGETNELKNQLKDWQESTKCRLNSECISWIIKNAPTMSVKAKGSVKKDLEAYDLETLESELEKILAVKEYENTEISLKTVQDLCKFEQSLDVWTFIRDAVQGNQISILSSLTEMGVSKSDQSALWLLANQLGLLISVRSLMEQGYSDSDRIASLAGTNLYLGKYLQDGWANASAVSCPPVNPWRVKKAMETTMGISSKQLAHKYISVISAIRDLRTGVPSDVVIPMLTLALTDMANYTKPLDDRY